MVDALTTSDAMGIGERLLIELASSWNDPRLVPFLVSQLRRATDSPPYPAEEIMDVVASVLGAKTLASLSEQYSELGSGGSESDDEQSAQSDSAGPSSSISL